MLTHREAGYCLEIAQEAALQARKHVWVDSSLRDHQVTHYLLPEP